MPLLWYLTIRDLLAGTLSQQLALHYVLGFLLSLVIAYIINNISNSSPIIKYTLLS